MKFLPLYDLQKEINRLFIAGSKFAKNDPRLQKQAAVFAKLGEKSPVFKKVAEGIENLVNAESADSSTKLLEVSTLLYSILYTQGETVDAEQQATELKPVLPLKDVNTNRSYLALKPLIEALSAQREGRLDDVKTAFENGQFNDFRIYHLFDAALADRYAEFADYIETTVIPAIGKPMIPFLLNGFSYEGKTGDIRRFRILSESGFSGILEMADKILTGNSSALLQAEAVKILSNDSKNEDLLIKYAGDKHKPIRLAAYKALANLNTETAQRTLAELFISGKRKQDVSELGDVLKIRLPDKFILALFEKAKAEYEKCLAFDKSADAKTVTAALENLMTSIKPFNCNINNDIIAFYRNMFTDKKFREVLKITRTNSSDSFSYEWLAGFVAKSLENTKGGLECLRFLTENSYSDEFLYSCFRASVRQGTEKETVYEYFSKHIDKLLYGEILADVFLDENGNPNRNYIDDRWIKLFAAKFPKKQNISFRLARVYIGLINTNKELQSFLSAIISSYSIVNDSFSDFAGLLINTGHPEAFEIIFKALSSQIKKGTYISHNYCSLFAKFPKEYAAKFNEAGDKLKSTNPTFANRHYYIASIIER
ncbi:MAG: HEAT repeat domain-containing protein [Prevotellaceae bacterium]|jgi:hypothetical protein|nr:HEAT repeat domain-containing protein [Prevotellaceae bacterium]